MLSSCNIAFPLIHGRNGEDGSIQGLLELAGLPYVGSGVAASAIAMNKIITKRLFQEAGLPTLPYHVITQHDWQMNRDIAIQSAETLKYPLFVKPAQGGSSIATHKVNTSETIHSAITDAFRVDSQVIVEKAIKAREIECAVLGNSSPIAAPLGEILYQREFYDYIAKYEDANTELVVPADLPTHLSNEIKTTALAAYQTIGCVGMGRVDFLIEENETIWLGEINTIPGFTKTSMFPRLWEEGGLTFPQLVTRLVELALEQHTKRNHYASQ
jgi:D-alanine-D-alanine ligase